jgi:dTDP-4-dehydrorhamnose 3,5-epimerase
MQVVEAGEGAARIIIIPAGVVHAYRNIGQEMGMVLNLPNRLYAGKEKKEPVDEIRHENDPNSPFKME